MGPYSAGSRVVVFILVLIDLPEELLKLIRQLIDFTLFATNALAA
jgi:hypothetical protein